MAYFDENDLTRVAIEKTYTTDYTALEILDRGASYIKELAENNFFLDNVQRYIDKNMEKLGCKNALTGKEEILNLVRKCYNDAGMKGDSRKGYESYNPRILKKWIYGDIVISRKEAYRFCFCMRMNIVEAEEFLFKGCLMKPFNFKDVTEAIYYFCLNTGRNYQKAIELIHIVKAESVISNPSPENDSIVIENTVKKMTEEVELIRYLVENREGFKEQSRRTIVKLKEEVERAVEFAKWERKAFFKDYGIPPIIEFKINQKKIKIKRKKIAEKKNIKVKMIKLKEPKVIKITRKIDLPALLSVILGYTARATEQINQKGNEMEEAMKNKQSACTNVYVKTIVDSKFPILISENFPQPQQLVADLKSKKPSVERLRKALILFIFYNMFAECKMYRIQYSGGVKFDEFSAELDFVLAECGYIQMYWRHPYDWMFGYCAGADEPLDELREMISCFYLDDEEIYR